MISFHVVEKQFTLASSFQRPEDDCLTVEKYGFLCANNYYLANMSRVGGSINSVVLAYVKLHGDSPLATTVLTLSVDYMLLRHLRKV